MKIVKAAAAVLAALALTACQAESGYCTAHPQNATACPTETPQETR